MMHHLSHSAFLQLNLLLGQRFPWTSAEEKETVGKCHAQLLAPELLAMIFHDVMALHERQPIILLPMDEKHLENEIDTEPLLALSHVCRYWRDVALGTPALWTRIHGGRRDQMEAFLERSRPLTVTLFLDVEHQGGKWYGPLPEKLASVVEARGPRLHRLDLSMIPSWDNVVPLLGSLKAPQLECLTITCSSPGGLFRDIGPSWGPLLHDDVSSLRALALMPVTDWLPSSTFPHLTHLVLFFDPEVPPPHHPFDLLRLLSNVPALAFLFLFYEESHMGNWRPPSQPILLRHLRSLVFTCCSYKLIRTVVSHLSLPEDVFIRLQDIDSPLGVDGAPAPLPPLPLRPVTSLDVVMRDEEILMVADGSASGLWLESHHEPGGAADPQAYQDWVGWLLTLHECLTLSHVTYLHIYVDGRQTFWPAFLAHLPQVSHLAVLLGKPGVEIDVLTGPYVESSPTTTLCDALAQEAPILCPALRTLTLEWSKRIVAENLENLPELSKMLRTRSRAGHPIRHVVVQAPWPSFDNFVRCQDFIEALARTISPRVADCEIVAEEGVGARGCCAFEMRDVWKVDGEDTYWEVGDYEKPHYALPRGLV
ncbi:hypothetical protein LXA43DRAFT_955863 [Ganoderma leucocontextum]|nr:hypothetical protein LXA43DRAFT_955863 [Ganoderma leucocontextum]